MGERDGQQSRATDSQEEGATLGQSPATTPKHTRGLRNQEKISLAPFIRETAKCSLPPACVPAVPQAASCI